MAIISFKYGFIFIKTTKTAGTSIETDLSQVVGSDDIVTPIIPHARGHQARNFLAEDGSQAFQNHMTAADIRSRIGSEMFESMHKFCLEREPVSKCISHFHMKRNSVLHNPGGRYRESWADYCNSGKFPLDLGKYSEVKDGRRVSLVNSILEYEKLDTDLPALLKQFGLDDFMLKSRAKSEYSRDTLLSVLDVTPSQREQIYSAFSQTIALTGLYSEMR